MGKKHKRYKPQVRKNTKATVGNLVLVDVIYMDREKDENGDIKAFGVCSCGEWRTSPEATTFTKIGMEAKAHVEDTGHQLRQF